MTAQPSSNVANPPCPSWCNQQFCSEWSQYEDHQVRYHGKPLDQMKDQLVTLEGPGELSINVEISAAERFDVDWDRLTLRHRVGEASIQLAVSSRGPADAAGKLPICSESVTDFTAAQTERLVDMLVRALQTLEGVTGGAE